MGVEEGHAEAPPAAAAPAPTTHEIEQALSTSSIFLKFPRSIERRFEDDTKRDRVRHARRMIILGLVFFNLYDAAGFVTVPEWGALNLALRLFVMTPTAIAIYVLIGRVSGPLRETMLGLGTLGATAIPIVVFMLSTTPLEASLSAVEILLSIAYANTTLALRFPWACFGTALSLVGVSGGLLLGHGLGLGLSLTLLLNIVTGFIYSLAAIYQMETSQRRKYLRRLRETLRSETLALDNLSLSTLSRTDALTGLPNRRAFDERLGADWDMPTDEPYSVILLDIDYFKGLNDRFGHGAGDTCLRRVAAALAVEFNGTRGLVARYGGEEFAVLLPGKASVDAHAFADRLRVAIYTLNIPHDGRADQVGRVTISAGVSSTGETGRISTRALIEAADRVLYQAKAAGRNRTLATTDESLGIAA